MQQTPDDGEPQPVVHPPMTLSITGKGAMSTVDHARRMMAVRRLRFTYLPSEIFGEPAWDMLLDLFIASHDSKPVSVSSACIASGAPATTALRWLARLEALDLVRRSGDHKDRRRIHVAITERGKQAIHDWLRHIADR